MRVPHLFVPPTSTRPRDVTLDDEFAPVLDAARAGADWAWTRLYADLAPVVHGYLRTRGTREPEDVLGEVFLQVVRDLERFDGDEAGFRSWVFTIAHRRIIDEGRRQGRRPVETADDADLELALPTAATGEAEALERMGTEDVVRILGVLTDEQRDALALRFVGGLSQAEVAEVTGRNANAVKALQRRALATLRRHLGTSPP